MSVFTSKLLSALHDANGDVTVTTCDSHEMKVHSFILQLSPVMTAQLTGPMLEAQAKTVNLHCETEVAQVFLEFLYVGSFNVTFN